MTGDFDWQTEEENLWEEASPGAPKFSQGSSRRLMFVLFLLLGIISTGVLIYRIIDRRTSDAANEIEAEILTAHSLVQRADRVDDLGLLRSSLSGRNKSWSAAQERLFASGSLLNRPAFNLVPLIDDPETPDEVESGIENIEVVLAPDLTSAELYYDQPFLVKEGFQSDTIVRLRQTATYRLGERWLLASPDRDFWGDQIFFAGEYLQATYPERDKAVIDRLAADLDNLVIQACQNLPEMNCWETMELHVQFEKGVDSLLSMGPSLNLDTQGLDLYLPSPTLVGVPVDEGGYQALFRAYGLILISSLISDLSGFQCCQQGPFHQALIHAQLHQLGMKSWPLSTSFRRDPDQRGGGSLRSLNDVGLFWHSDQESSPVEEAWPVYALVDFLGRLSNLSMAEMQLRLVLAGEITSEMGYWAWLQFVTEAVPMSRQGLERAWLAYNQEMFADQGQLVPALPVQDLMLVCRPILESNSALYRYDVADESMNLKRPLGDEDRFLVGLPSSDGVIIPVERASDLPGTILVQWQEGREDTLVESSDVLIPLPYSQNHQSQLDNLLTLNRRTRQYSLFSIEECLGSTSCMELVYHGFPIWSPEGSSHLLLISMGSAGYEKRFERPISLGGPIGEIIGVGKEPFWLNENSAAFINDLGTELRSVDAGTKRQSVLLTVDDIIEVLPESELSKRSDLILDFAATNPSDHESLLIIVRHDNKIYFLSSNLDGSGLEAEQILDNILAYEFGTNYGFSPDGRWLVISTSNPTNALSAITLYDPATKETLHYPFHSRYELPMHWQLDWSTDGQWLSIIDNGNVRIIAPDSDYQKLIVPDELSCSAASWIN